MGKASFGSPVLRIFLALSPDTLGQNICAVSALSAPEGTGTNKCHKVGARALLHCAATAGRACFRKMCLCAVTLAFRAAVTSPGFGFRVIRW